ncbi:MAG: ATP-binding cassette domain-containing protein [Atribacterota bacterium]|nr:ATP-binding cassette domain-containing protein [Atribacterota bacterium]
MKALNSLDMVIEKNKIHGIVGPNGAGKTTLINIITGLECPTSGEIFFQGQKINKAPPEIIFEMGITRTFQEGKIVPNLTVLENIIIGFLKKKEQENYNIVSIFSGLAKYFQQKQKDIKKGKDLLKKFDLQYLADKWADDLAWNEIQLVQIVRAIASDPLFLLLDEPTAGMNEKEKIIIKEKMFEINRSGVTILLVSHDIPFIKSVVDNLTVLNFGEKISEGPVAQVLADPKVWEVYLGS